MDSMDMKTLLFITSTFLLIKLSQTLTFTKTSGTFAKFPKWNACINSSISFEFKTTASEALLLYTDDNGKFDYVDTMLIDGRLRLRMNIVDGKDGTVEMTLGQRLNDRRWHRVEIKRNRMETTLYVDSYHDSRVAFGSDFHFGDVTTNNYVYIGGLPQTYYQGDTTRLQQLSLPSAFFVPRFQGKIRNVIYGNCTCRPVRAEMIEGLSVTKDPPEACEANNDCGTCLCISGDDGPGCQCVGFDCPIESVDEDGVPAVVDTYYQLPMDRIAGYAVVNPSGLDAKVTGSPRLVNGAVGNAIRIDCSSEKVKVSGPGHRHECFGDLSLCPKGYTLAMWLKFDEVGAGRGVYLSNGGERTNSHGVAMLYENGRLDWIFRMQSGREWRISMNNFLARKWYHVMVTWEEKSGLVLYINGNKAAHDETPSTRLATSNSPYNDFVIGQSNDGSASSDLGIMTIDELQFWSTVFDEYQLREQGPIYSYHISMDQLHDGQLIVPNLEPNTRGRLRQVPGKIGDAISIPGRGQYIDLGSFTDSCLGNTTLCMYGFTVAFWIKIDGLEDNSYYMASGPYGFSIFSYSDRLYASVQNGDRQWQTSVSGIQTGLWYFVEVTWNKISGLELFLDQRMVASQRTSSHNEINSNKYNSFFIGRANTVMFLEKYASATIDDLYIYNADRDRLLSLDFIQRGKPDDHYYNFDTLTNSRIDHPTTLIDTRGDVKLVPGKIGQAVRLNGQQQVVEFDHGNDCLGNLDFCNHGVLLALWLKLERLDDGMFYLSSSINGIELSMSAQKLRATAETSTQKWEVMTSLMASRAWHFIEVSWSPEEGLKLYSDNELLKADKYPRDKKIANSPTKTTNDKFYLGKENSGGTGSVYGAAVYDEMEYWYGPRDYLLAFDYIQRGKPDHYIVHMDNIIDKGKRVAHALLPITLTGYPELVPGKIDNAIKLNGNEQYIDIGDHSDKCLGSLKLCKFGISIFMWVKIEEYDYNMYLLSTGADGVRLYYNQDFIYITLNNDRKSWRISVPEITKDDWHFLEMSWHPDFGLTFYLDGELQDHVMSRDIPEQYSTDRNHFYIGRPNAWDVQGQRFSYGNMAVDELEVWYARREVLVAFDYILRDNLGYESFSMETASDDVIDHPNYRVTLVKGARLAPGEVGNAVSLQGLGDYVDLGEHMDKCFANIDVCNQGLTIAMLLKPESLKTNQYFLSSPTYSLYLENGQLKADFFSNGKYWNVSTGNLAFNDWNDVMLSWNPDEGLDMYLDGKMVGSNSVPNEMSQNDARAPGSVYIGKSSDDSIQETAEMMADEVQYWYANLRKLRARGLVKGPVHETIPLAQMPSSGTLLLPGRRISLQGGATVNTTRQGRVISLSGKGQYIDMGDNLTCGGDLNNCRQGFTLRFTAKPDKLSNNMYFLDSYPLSIFYRDGRLYATVRTDSKTWTVAAPGFKVGEWQNVDVSWHPEIGLTMFVNEEEVGAHKTHGIDIEPVYDYDRGTYFGRAMTNMLDERYADTSVGSFDLWNVRRDVLMSKNLIKSGLVPELTSARPVVTPRPTLPTPIVWPTLPPLPATRRVTLRPLPSSDDADKGKRPGMLLL